MATNPVSLALQQNSQQTPQSSSSTASRANQAALGTLRTSYLTIWEDPTTHQKALYRIHASKGLPDGTEEPLQLTTQQWKDFSDQMMKQLIPSIPEDQRSAANLHHGQDQFFIQFNPQGIKVATSSSHLIQLPAFQNTSQEIRESIAKYVSDNETSGASLAPEEHSSDELEDFDSFPQHVIDAPQNLRNTTEKLNDDNLIFGAQVLCQKICSKRLVIYDEKTQGTLKLTESVFDPTRLQIDGLSQDQKNLIVHPQNQPIFIPLLFQTHFVLLFYDPSNGQWNFYDSYSLINDEKDREGVSSFDCLKKSLSLLINTPNIVLVQKSPEEIQAPSDTKNCGAYVLRKIHKILDPNLDIHQDILAYRTDLGKVIEDQFDPDKTLQATIAHMHSQNIAPPRPPQKLQLASIPPDAPPTAKSKAIIYVWDASSMNIVSILQTGQLLGRKILVGQFQTFERTMKNGSTLATLAHPRPNIFSFKDVISLRTDCDRFNSLIPSGTDLSSLKFDVYFDARQETKITPADFENDTLTELARRRIKGTIFGFLAQAFETLHDGDILIIPDFPMEGLTSQQKREADQTISNIYRELLTSYFKDRSIQIYFAINRESDGSIPRETLFHTFARKADGSEIKDSDSADLFFSSLQQWNRNIKLVKDPQIQPNQSRSISLT